MKTCPITKKGYIKGGGYSNRTRATKFNPTGIRKRYANLQKKTIFVPELGKKITVSLSTSALRTMAKKGIYKTLKEAGVI